jgi:hypothetical protein
MTDRFNTLTVVLEKDIRDDDAETLLTAIRQMRGVLSVEGNVSDTTAHMAEERAKHELGQKLWEVIYPKG